jgi:uncharacterized protein YkwD
MKNIRFDPAHLACLLVALLLVALVCLMAASARGDVPADCLTAHNSARKRAGLEPLRLERHLAGAAQAHAEWCARIGHLTHYGPHRNTWADRARQAGYHATLSSCSENVAWGYDDGADVTGGWLRSRGHRSNVLSRQWIHVGFGCSAGRNGRLYFCALYARPASVMKPRE